MVLNCGEREKNNIMLNFIVSFMFFFIFYISLLFLKTSENNFYFFFKNYSLFYFIFKKLFPKNNDQTTVGIVKNSILFLKLENYF